MQMQTGIITISDRASKGLYDDLGGPALKKAAADAEPLIAEHAQWAIGRIGERAVA